MAATSQHRCVFVGNIPYDATEEQLIQICEEVGPVVSFRLVLDRETGKPKGYGFCEYKDEETALSARRNLQGYEINGRQLRVDFAENDKGADRNREQGRGGPGLASNADAQKPLSGGPAAHVDPVLYQPIGIQLAMTSASVMAGALGGSQMGSGQLNQNGSQGQSGLGNDPLSHYLAKMSRAQLHEILTHFKAMATENKELARQLLLANPLLPKALFQAEIMLGMVSPQMLQMPNLRQSSRLTTQPALNVDKRLIHPSHSGQGSQASLQNIPQTGLLPRVPKDQAVSPVNLTKDTFISQSSSSSLPLQHHLFVQPRLPQYPQQSQPEILSGNLSTSSIRPAQPFAGHSPQLPLPNSNFSHPILPRPSSSQLTFQPGLSNSSALLGVDTISREAGSSLQVGQDTNLEARKDTLYTANHPSKLRRLEDGSKESAIITSNTSLTGPGQGIGTEPVFSNQMGIVHGPPQPEKQVSQLAIPPEVESALLQQVMNLTAEQLSSLPPEQQQQVLQLQQMLR